MQICETIQIFQIINDGNVVELGVCCLFPPPLQSSQLLFERDKGFGGVGRESR